MWPVKVDDIRAGAVLLGRTGKRRRAQVRRVLETGRMPRYGIQMNDDCASYEVIAGHGAGRTGFCTRIGLASWAELVQFEETNETHRTTEPDSS